MERKQDYSIKLKLIPFYHISIGVKSYGIVKLQHFTFRNNFKEKKLLRLVLEQKITIQASSQSKF